MALSNEDKKWIKDQLRGKSSGGTPGTAVARIDYNVPATTSKKEINTGDPEMDRYFKLVQKRRRNQESLAERIELEKLSIKLKLTAPVRNIQKGLNRASNAINEKFSGEGWKDTRKIIGTSASSLGRAASELGKGVGGAVNQLGAGLQMGGMQAIGALKADKTAQDALRVLIYSNPVTAILAEYAPLLKGLGGAAKNILGGGIKAAGSILGGIGGATKAIGGGIGDIASYFYGKGKNKNVKSGRKNRLFTNDLLEDKEKVENQSSYGGNNYILAQKATFNGGKNTIIVAGSNLAGAFKMKKDLENPTQKLLSGPKDYIDAEVVSSKTEKATTKLLTKGLDGIREEVKKSNKFLDIFKKNHMLIIGGILLAGAALLGLSVWLKNKFGGGLGGLLPQATPNITSADQMKSFGEQSNQTAQQSIDKLQQGINNEAHISKYDQFNKQVSVNDKDGLFGKAAKMGYNAMKMQSGYQAESKEGSVYRAPFNMKVLSWKENNKKLGVVNIIAEKIVPKGINKNVEIMNIKDPVVLPGEFVKKMDPIGLVGPTGKIMIKDIDKSDFEDYLKEVNKIADSSTKQNFDLSKEKRDKLNQAMKNMAVLKAEGKDTAKITTHGVDTDFSKNSYHNQSLRAEKQIYQNNIDRIKKAIANGESNIFIDGKKISKDQFQEELQRNEQGLANIESVQSPISSLNISPTSSVDGIPQTNSVNVTKMKENAQKTAYKPQSNTSATQNTNTKGERTLVASAGSSPGATKFCTTIGAPDIGKNLCTPYDIG